MATSLIRSHHALHQLNLALTSDMYLPPSGLGTDPPSPMDAVEMEDA